LSSETLFNYCSGFSLQSFVRASQKDFHYNPAALQLYIFTQQFLNKAMSFFLPNPRPQNNL
jgi:hypothetical protein